MIKKAYEKPREVEYIEFKGKENFKEVGEFIEENVFLITNAEGQERLMRNGIKDNVTYPIGTIFYEYYDEEIYDYVIKVSNKKSFFDKYGDIN
ncbi:hypothetical protein JJL02_02830 [Staphylococcus haemolyticus]|uniref:hypothetical protein n=1 Tax=Staphylococcus haemolyticus TaxID=1283 RepID=UPI00190D5572|nr:hypothetical protein [Staphylococcus haemolyticus]MBK3950186.1 hypothetical protein [Staphylococcus haemolyticus]